MTGPGAPLYVACTVAAMLALGAYLAYVWWRASRPRVYPRRREQ